jgi:hypothetical protein
MKAALQNYQAGCGGCWTILTGILTVIWTWKR